MRWKVKDLNFTGGPHQPESEWKLKNFAAMKTPLCLLFLKWESSVRKMRGLVLANDREYILECRTSSLLSKPRRDSSFMKLGSGGPISLSVLQRSSAISRGNLQNLQKVQLPLPTMGCMSAKSPGIGKRVPVFTTTTITIDAGQQKQVRSTPPGLQKSKLSIPLETLRSSRRQLDSHHFSHWQKTTCNVPPASSCSVKPHAMLRRFPKLPPRPQITN